MYRPVYVIYTVCICRPTDFLGGIGLYTDMPPVVTPLISTQQNKVPRE